GIQCVPSLPSSQRPPKYPTAIDRISSIPTVPYRPTAVHGFRLIGLHGSLIIDGEPAPAGGFRRFFHASDVRGRDPRSPPRRVDGNDRGGAAGGPAFAAPPAVRGSRATATAGGLPAAAAGAIPAAAARSVPAALRSGAGRVRGVARVRPAAAA